MEQRFKTNIRKHSFAVRVAKIWNKLPENITNTPFLNTSKSRLDRFMENEIYTTQISEQNFHLNPEAEESENSHTSSSQIQRF